MSFFIENLAKSTVIFSLNFSFFQNFQKFDPKVTGIWSKKIFLDKIPVIFGPNSRFFWPPYKIKKIQKM